MSRENHQSITGNLLALSEQLTGGYAGIIIGGSRCHNVEMQYLRISFTRVVPINSFRFSHSHERHHSQASDVNRIYAKLSLWHCNHDQGGFNREDEACTKEVEQRAGPSGRGGKHSSRGDHDGGGFLSLNHSGLVRQHASVPKLLRNEKKKRKKKVQLEGFTSFARHHRHKAATVWEVDPSNLERKYLISSSRVTLLSNMPVPENAKDAAENLKNLLCFFLIPNKNREKKKKKKTSLTLHMDTYTTHQTLISMSYV
ncbi:hypothetical protein HYC85_021154 [Camellia sinensis]|uniref:Uncharacterized protein n=1 Tax=Camellia sinensis TaxID=4442 RepID=A0A7J7GHL6_CAMSI|nr:hypothetical protein HYC85_021154 [Camellia sinensis]